MIDANINARRDVTDGALIGSEGLLHQLNYTIIILS